MVQQVLTRDGMDRTSMLQVVIWKAIQPDEMSKEKHLDHNHTQALAKRCASEQNCKEEPQSVQELHTI